jgi:hypothetical protein
MTSEQGVPAEHFAVRRIELLIAAYFADIIFDCGE